MSEMITLPTVDHGGLIHSRTDRWWITPLTQLLIMVAFIFYSTFVILFDEENSVVENTNYISPFYSPEVAEPSFWPEFLSPALILVWIPLGFRFTCYYARKMYHRAFLADPPACAVGEFRSAHKEYTGENKLPFLVSNFHRYFFYLAFLLAIAHIWNFFHAMFFVDGFGLGIGTLLLGVDALFLSLYVLSCHSCKHLVGGSLNSYSTKASGVIRYKSWKFIQKLNNNHHAYYWLSLISIVIADVYIRLLSVGIISITLDRLF